jgi:hypothetical protein
MNGFKDEKGFKWHTQDFETGSLAQIIDEGGKERIVRGFNFIKDPIKPQSAMEIYTKHIPFIKQTLYDSGLTTDDNFEPKIQDYKDSVLVTIIGKKVGTRMSKGRKDKEL